MNAEISETMRARLLRFGVQIPELRGQLFFVQSIGIDETNTLQLKFVF